MWVVFCFTATIAHEKVSDTTQAEVLTDEVLNLSFIYTSSHVRQLLSSHFDTLQEVTVTGDQMKPIITLSKGTIVSTI